MNLKNRLAKLEIKANPLMAPLLMVPATDNHWTPEQLQQMKEAETQGRLILKVNFVEPNKHDSN